MRHTLRGQFVECNPFLLGRDASGDSFCARVKETESLCRHLANGLNTVLTGSRQIGKTTLIEHLFHQADVRRYFHCIYVDITITSSFQELVYRLVCAVIKTFEGNVKALDRLVSTVKSIRFNVSTDPVTDVPSLQFPFDAIHDPELTLGEVFAFLDRCEKRTVIAFDEFQQITTYKEKGVEAALRSKVQLSTQINVIFAGSDKMALWTMFSSVMRPFYLSATFLHLEAIDRADYRTYAQTKFEAAGKCFPTERFDALYDFCQGRTGLVERVLHQVFALTTKGETVTESQVRAAVEHWVSVLTLAYEDQLRSLTLKQKGLLLAIATVGEARALQGQVFCQRFGLGTPSSVRVAKNALVKKGLIVRNGDAWVVDDMFLGLWLKKMPMLR